MPTLSFRLSARELSEVRRRARAAGKNVSTYARAALVPAEPPAGRPRLVRDKASGHLILHPPPGVAPLTTERVKELLADFP